ncbi:MAG: hypothetical protein KA035_02460 [Candidatus Levybacteria bacterium]|nr:hypothetical protein [Candidatus Levybacteria bacterium]
MLREPGTIPLPERMMLAQKRLAALMVEARLPQPPEKVVKTDFGKAEDNLSYLTSVIGDPDIKNYLSANHHHKIPITTGRWRGPVLLTRNQKSSIFVSYDGIRWHSGSLGDLDGPTPPDLRLNPELLERLASGQDRSVVRNLANLKKNDILRRLQKGIT